MKNSTTHSALSGKLSVPRNGRTPGEETVAMILYEPPGKSSEPVEFELTTNSLSTDPVKRSRRV